MGTTIFETGPVLRENAAVVKISHDVIPSGHNAPYKSTTSACFATDRLKLFQMSDNIIRIPTETDLFKSKVTFCLTRNSWFIAGHKTKETLFAKL